MRLGHSSAIFALSISLLGFSVLGLHVPQVIAVPTAQVNQQEMSEIDQAIAEGMRLFNEGSAESLRKAIVQFEKALELARSAKAQDKQAVSLSFLGYIYDALGEKQKALDYYNKSLLLYRAVGDRGGEAATLNNIGSVYSALGEKQKALEFYNKSLPLLRAVGDRTGEATTLNNIGLVYNALGDKQKALEFCNQALSMDRAVGNREGEATTLTNIAGVYSDLGEKQKALDFYNQALSLLRTIGNRGGEAATLTGIGLVYSDLGEKQKALKFYNQALPLFRTIGDRGGEATTLNNIGNVYSDLGEKQKALEFYNQALPLRRAIGDRAGEAATLNSIGSVYSALGEQQKALELYNQALLLHRAVRDRGGEAATLTNIGSVYSDLGEKQKALAFYNQALLPRRAVLDRAGEATTLNSIGNVYYALGEKQKVLAFYNQALLLNRAVRDRGGEARTLNNIGNVYSDLGEKQKALAFYNQALPVFRAVGDRTGEATTLNNIGLVYNDLGERQKGLAFFNQALLLRRAVVDRAGEAMTLTSIGLVYAALGEKQKALEFYNQSLPLSRTVGDREGEAATLNNIGFVLAVQKQPEIAIAILKQSVNVYESIRKDNQQINRELRESYTQKIASTYQRLSSLLIKQGRLPEAQAVLELLKLKELNTYTRDLPKTSPGISFTPAEQKALDEFLKTYTTAANFARQITECAGKCANLAALETQRDRVNTAIREMLDRLRSTLKDQTIDLSKLNTEEFNNAAREIVNAQPGTILIYPIVTETKIQFLLAFKAGAGDQAPVTFRAIDGDTLNSEDLFKTSDAFRKALGTPTSDLKTLQATSQKLYNWLIKPLEPEINQPHIKHLVFATDRATRHIPLAALHDGKTYLINKPYTISTILAAKGTEPAAPRPTAPNVLAVGASQFQTANPLRYVEQETQAIVQIFPGDRYLNSQFNFATLKQHLSKHNILHIATHGSLDPVNIDNSYLLTSSGEKIAKPEITLLGDYGLNNIHMVILSACDTGTGGKNTDGLEIAGISHYFMRGGAKSVIASLWQVNDPATALFMQQFYKQLKTGTTKAQAIQQVQQEFIAGKRTAQDVPGDRSDILVQPAPGFVDRQASPANFTHPYYWAPFILIGNSL
jgi:CHAT domain-containing protein/Flp pilus assembly protein TadD